VKSQQKSWQNLE